MNILQYMTSGEAAGEMYVYVCTICLYVSSTEVPIAAGTHPQNVRIRWEATLLQILLHKIMIMTVRLCTIVACTAYLMDYQHDKYFCHKDSSGTQNLMICISNEFKEKRGGGGRNSFADIYTCQ
jgi:hypothetical protein